MPRQMRWSWASAIASAGCFCCALMASETPPSMLPAPSTMPAQATTGQPATAPTTRPGVTLISVHLRRASRKQVFAALQKQANVRFQLTGAEVLNVSPASGGDVDIDHQPFWPAVLGLCDRWNLQVGAGTSGNPREIQLSQKPALTKGQKPTELPLTDSDGVWIQATTFQRRQSVDYADPEDPAVSCSIHLTLLVDPSLHVLSLSPTARIIQAADRANRSFATPDNPNGYNGGISAALVRDCTVPLLYPHGAGHELALQCEIPMRVIDATQTFSVDHPLTSGEVDQTLGDRQITFVSLKADEGDYLLTLGITHADGDGNYSADDNAMLQGARLLDADGHPFKRVTDRLAGIDAGVFQYTATYRAAPGKDATTQPMRWTVEVPTAIRAVNVQANFANLPLP